MLGIRASPSGTYLLILLRGKPAEIWLVRFRASGIRTGGMHSRDGMTSMHRLPQPEQRA